MKRFLAPLPLGLLLALVPAAARAHAEHGHGGGFVAGFLHPITGPDHVVAMVAVGLWGAVLGPPALWVLPVAFPLVMAFGGLLGLLGVPIPGVEIGIAVSGLVMGLMVLFELRPPLWLAALIVSAFAVFHGHAHGAELAALLGETVAIAVLTTLLGQLLAPPHPRWRAIAVRVGGSWITAASLLMFGWLVRHPQ